MRISRRPAGLRGPGLSGYSRRLASGNVIIRDFPEDCQPRPAAPVQVTKVHPTRKVLAPVFTRNTGRKVTRTGGRMGTCSTAGKLSW